MKGKAATSGSFQPGNRAHGRENLPRGRFITQQLISQLNEEMDDPEFDPKNKDHVRKRVKTLYFFCRKMIKLALAGDMQAARLIMHQIEGTPKQTVDFVQQRTPEEIAADEARRGSAAVETLRTKSADELVALYHSKIQETSSADTQH